MASSSLSIKEKEIFEEIVAFNPIDPDAGFGGCEERKRLERKLVQKLDWRLSILLLIYFLNYIDRNNVTTARLRGFESDLNLKGREYDSVLSLFYVGYILMQVPSNMFMNFIGRPSVYIPICMVIWGVISTLTGVTKSFIGVLLTRFFLGFVEAAFFPGALFLLSKWYTRGELGLRMSMLVSANLVSNAVGSLIASGILDGMQGKLGQPAWRWLFYIEGSVTTVVAIVTIFILPDFPDNTRWLTPLERSLALRRMMEDGGINTNDLEGVELNTEPADSADESCLRRKPVTGKLSIQCHGLWLAVTDWRVWWLGVALVAQVAASSFFQFFPTLTATLGFNRTVTLVLAAPPWFVAATAAFFNSRHSDKRGERFFHILAPLAVGIIGFVVGISTMNLVARYISLFMIALSYLGYMIMFSWASSSMPRPPAKRAVVLGFLNGFSQLGNVAGSYIWPTKWGPSYRNSYAICISLQGLTIIMCWIFQRHLKSLNEQLDKEEQERGDRRKGFRYML